MAVEERLQVVPQVGVGRQQLAPVGLLALFERLDVVQEDPVSPLFSLGVADEFTPHGLDSPGSSEQLAKPLQPAKQQADGRRAACGRSAPPRRQP